MDRKDCVSDVETVVIKIGTSSITGGTSGVSEEFMDSVARQVKEVNLQRRHQGLKWHWGQFRGPR